MAKVSKTDQININRNIRAKEVRVIGHDAQQLGILDIKTALEKASDYGLDLVEVSPSASPPVCKIMDFGKYKYDMTKKLQEAKKKQTSFTLKEIKLRPKTSDHDLNIKIGHIKRFIGKKNKVKVTVMFRGREITLSDRGKALLKKVIDETEEIAVVEQEPKFEGRIMIMVLAPK